VPVDFDRLAAFAAGYLVILATPGPNLIAVSGVAALHGLRGVFPLCLGISMGAGALGATLVVAITVAPENGEWHRASRLIGAALLVWLAYSIARQPAPSDGAPARLSKGDGLTAFGAGFFTALTNPLTATFFTAQFLGPLRDHEATVALAPLAIVAVALTFFLCVSALLARAACRATVLAWHRPICLSAATMLVLMALAAVKIAF
jgi:threonine/homoserine/homoserine lactone efflux protein